MPALLRIELVCLVLLAGTYDLRYRRIPNWLSLSGIVLGLGCNTLLLGLAGLRGASLGLLCALAIYVPLYLVRGMGAGDVKLMAAVGAMAGPKGWLEIFLATALLGGVASLVLVARKHRVQQTLGNMAAILAELLQFRRPARRNARLDVRHREAIGLPHAAAIAAGSLIFLLFSATHSS